MSFENNYLMNLGGNSLGIFRKLVDLIALLNKLKINIFLPIGKNREVRKIPMDNILIMLGHRLFKGVC